MPEGTQSLPAETELIAKVHQANAEAHDFVAELHDRNVPYISRPKTRQYYWRLIKDTCASHRKSFQGARVLEVGCGTGTFTDLALIEGAISFHGIDLSQKMIEKAKSKIQDTRITYQVSSLEEFAKAHEEEFDIIYSASFLHHLVDLEGGVQLLNSMLRPGGVYVAIHEVVTPRLLTWVDRFDDLLQYIFGYAGAIYTPLPQRIGKVFKEVFWEPTLGRVGATLKAFLWTILRAGWRVVKPIIRRGQQKAPVRTTPASSVFEQPTDYVDYQLNGKFSLQDRVGSYGSVIPYCYLCYVELMAVSKPMNHQMFVMVKS